MENEAAKLSDVVSLAQGVPWYPVPHAIQEFVMEKIKKWQTNRYSVTPGIPQLRQQIALRYYKKYWIDIDFDNEVVITAGAIQAISSILLTLVDTNDEVILIDPCYASYKGCVLTSKWKFKYAPLDENLDLDVGAVLDNINENTKVILLANPNNPTGSIFPVEKIKAILDYIKWKDIVLIVDEVYDEFIYDENDFVSVASIYQEYKENLIITNSWSKTFGMTGWRIGYFMTNSKLTSEIIKIHDWLITCAPVHSQWAALASFEIYDSWTDRIRKDLHQKRKYAIERCQRLSWYIDFKIPDAAYFLFPKFKYTDDDYWQCLKILKEQNLSLVPGLWFGDKGKWHFRLCFGRDFDDLEEGFDRLWRYFGI